MTYNRREKKEKVFQEIRNLKIEVEGHEGCYGFFRFFSFLFFFFFLLFLFLLVMLTKKRDRGAKQTGRKLLG